MTHAMHQNSDTVRTRLTQLGSLIDGLPEYDLAKSHITAVTNARAAAQNSITILFDRAGDDRRRCNKEAGERQSATLQRAYEVLLTLDRKLELNQRGLRGEADAVKTDFDGFGIEKTIQAHQQEIREAYFLIPEALNLDHEQTQKIRRCYYGLAMQVRRAIVSPERIGPIRKVVYMYLSEEIDEKTATYYAAEINCRPAWASVYGETASYIDLCIEKIEIMDRRFGQLTLAVDKILISSAHRTKESKIAFSKMIYLMLGLLDEFVSLLLKARKSPSLPDFLKPELVQPERT